MPNSIVASLRASATNLDRFPTSRKPLGVYAGQEASKSDAEFHQVHTEFHRAANSGASRSARSHQGTGCFANRRSQYPRPTSNRLGIGVPARQALRLSKNKSKLRGL